MKHRFVTYGVMAAAMAGVLLLILLSFPAAQNTATKAPATVPTPRLTDGHPDFSGFYGSDRFEGDPVEERPGEHVINRLPNGSVFYDYAGANTPQLAALKEKDNQPPYKPEYMAKVNAIAADMYGGNSNHDPELECKPGGVPRTSVGTMQVVHKPDVVAILYEAEPGPNFRLIYTDGRKHPENLDSSFMGHSIGHWEGDTLVVDVVGLNDETWLGGAQSGVEKHTSIHSDQLHVTERWTRSGNTLSYQATAEDPVMFTKPWMLEPRRVQLAPEKDYIQPQMCVGLDKGHIIRETENDKYLCGWCNPQSVYGVQSDKLTTLGGQDVPTELKDAAKTKQ
jgi:hypothetical protein